MAVLSARLRALPGKSGPGGWWLPVWIHMLDTARCMAWLIEVRHPDWDIDRRKVVLAAMLHDIGKFTPAFIDLILGSLPEHWSVLEHCGVEIAGDFRRSRDVHHTRCGESILLNAGFHESFACITGAHHGMPVSDAEDIDAHMDRFDKYYFVDSAHREFWMGIWDEWIRYALDLCGFESVSDVGPLSEIDQMKLSGLLIEADWMASNTEFFGRIGPDEFLDAYPAGRAEAGIVKAGLTSPWQGSLACVIGPEGFRDRFGFMPNAVQSVLCRMAQEMERPGMFIVEAPMGSGKTEAALGASEALAAKFKKGGLFIGLPTQATANGIFSRVLDWAGKQSDGDFHSIRLAHGAAAYNELFSSLPVDVPNIDPDDPDGGNDVLVQSFFAGSKRATLSDFCVGTVDRLLSPFLKKRHATLQHLGLVNKVVIVDEVHAYDAYMGVYLDRALRWLGAYGVPVILLSATLPDKRRRELMGAYAGKSVDSGRATYPRISWTDVTGLGCFTEHVEVPSQVRRTVKIVRAKDDRAVYDRVKKAVADGACIGVICNTVRRAQAMFDEISKIPGVKAISCHAQYIAGDKLGNEDLVLQAVGKNSDGPTRAGTVVVGTQVLEQSLDLDFDLLVTDLCPVDLLLQRLGRLHRHDRRRPDGYTNPECLVLCADELDKGAVSIYRAWPTERAAALLPDHIVLPDDIDALVNEAYRDDDTMSESWLKWNLEIDERKNRARAFLMRAPSEDDDEVTLHDLLTCELKGGESAEQAMVRDGGCSVEAVVLVRQPDGLLSIVPWRADGRAWRTDVCPGVEDAKAISAETIRLPYSLAGPHAVGRTLASLEAMTKEAAPWQRSPWLKGALFLILDENLSGQVGDKSVKYDRTLGLVVNKAVSA